MDTKLHLLVIMLSLTPAIEVRGAIPVGIACGLDPLLVFTLAFSASLLPAPLLVYGLHYIEENVFPKIFSRAKILEMIYRRTIERARSKAERISRSKYTYIALALFVGIPSPGTGVWTGSLVAYLLRLDKTRSLVAISIGNFIASLIVFMVAVGIKIVLN